MKASTARCCDSMESISTHERYSFEVMQLGGWAIYLTSVLSSTTPDSIIYSKDYRLWGGIKVISAILSGFQPILTRF